MTMRSIHAQAVVIGGGPGGSMSALKLARMGWDVMLIERDSRYRHKACGHCLNQRAMQSLRREGLLSTVMARARTRTQRFRVHGANSSVIESTLLAPGKEGISAGFVVDRSELDQVLLDRAAAAGARIVQPASAKIRPPAGNGIIVEVASGTNSFTVRTNLLIGADGVGSGIARAAGLVSRGDAGRKFGFSFGFEPGYTDAICDDAIEMFLVHGGYLGFVGCGEGVFHVAGLVDNRANDPRMPLAFVHAAAHRHGMLKELGLHRMAAEEMRHFKAIGPMPWRPRKVATSLCDAHIVLVGDAARYIEPFTGEGIGWAFATAEVVAECAARCERRQWTARATWEYEHLWRERIGRRQRLCSALAWMLERPLIANLMLRVGSNMPRLTDRVTAQVVTA